ncbi:MAG TPA: peptide chain release factor N(5)-glutamine methyltransferase [Capsulimonadaceae bacterium]|nr:peptide chain release factor N(5)-glutamine methyltransferase [Capsulimonadaceae bacterium]
MRVLSVNEALQYAMPVLAAAGVETPRLDAKLLLAWTLAARREDLARAPERVLTERERLIFEKAVSLRALRRPLPYITGEQWFYGRPFKINRAVLIPRPETELLVEFAKDKARQWPGTVRIADIGTGSGAIAVSLALEIPRAEIWAVDISRLALLVAAKNVRRHNVAQQVHLGESDLFAGLRRHAFHIIVSNPPYVPLADRETLMPEVRDYEPELALYEGAGPAGTALHERLIDEARPLLTAGGWLAMEVGLGQAQRVRQIAEVDGYNEITTIRDPADIERVIAGRKA